MDELLDKLLEAAEQFSEHIYETTTIVIGNPSDLIKLNTLKIPHNVCFISSHYVDKGKMYKIEDGELKRSLYEFIVKYPDRVFRGEK